MDARRAVILDLDGTLIDSAPDLLVTANALLVETGDRQLSLHEIIPMIGDGIPALVTRIFAEAGATPSPPELGALTERFVEIYLDPHRPQLTRLYDAVPQTLATLKEAGYLLGVCTNKIERAAGQLLRELGIGGTFDVIVGGDSTPAKKPDPKHVLAVLDRLGVQAGNAVTVGDSGNDVTAGLAAGTKVVGVTYGYGNVSEMIPKPTRTIDRFADLPTVLSELEAECRASTSPTG